MEKNALWQLMMSLPAPSGQPSVSNEKFQTAGAKSQLARLLSIPNVNFSVDDMGGGPQYQGSASVPMFGGNIGVSGGYSRPNPVGPADWSAFLNYRKQF